MITPEKVEALRTFLRIAGGYCDRGPEGEGWQSDALEEAIKQVRSLLDDLTGPFTDTLIKV